MNKIVSQAALAASLMLLLSACEWTSHPTAASQDPALQRGTEESELHQAMADQTMKEAPGLSKQIDLMDTKGAKVGRAVLSQAAEGVKVQIEVSGLPPGKHGFHIHQFGVCTAPDFKSAGEHFNPEGKKHGFENPEGYHAGDMINLEVGSDGKGRAEIINKKATLEKDKANSLLKPGGTALVIHEAADDYKTDPTGNSGARIACGVIL